MNSEDGQVYSVCILQFSCFMKYNRMQSKHKQTKCDETLTEYSFLSRYHHTKSKNYLKSRYRIRHWIPMFIGTPSRIKIKKKKFYEKKIKGLLTCFKVTLIDKVAWPIYDDTLKFFLRLNIMFLLIILSVVYLYKSDISISFFRNNEDKTLFILLISWSFQLWVPLCIFKGSVEITLICPFNIYTEYYFLILI